MSSIPFMTNCLIELEPVMNSNLESPLQTILSQLLPVLLSFSDDTLLFVLSRLGFPIPGIDWLSPILLGFTVSYWAIKFLRHGVNRAVSPEVACVIR
jgi:hypothetical protein